MKESNLLIQEVSRSHAALVPVLFPQARDLAHSPALYGIVDPAAPSALLGIALLASPSGNEDPSFRFAIKVANAPDSEQVHRTLLQHVVIAATQLRAPSLRNLQPVNDAAAQQRMEHFGFQLLRTTTTHGFALATGFAALDRQMAAFTAAGRIPAGVTSTPYGAGGGREMSALCLAELGHLTYGHQEAIGEFPAPGKDFSLATAFWLDGVLVGGLGVAVEDGIAVVDPLLIAPGKRNTWAFTYMLHTVARGLLAKGIGHGRTQIHRDNQKMMALLRRTETHVASTALLYQLDLHCASEQA